VAWQSFKEKSRENFGREFCGAAGQNVTWQEVRDAALLRIADATEKMSGHYSVLIEERDRYQRYYKNEEARRIGLERRARGLRGVITRLKKQAKKGR
jgi:hypothetical protein